MHLSTVPEHDGGSEPTWLEPSSKYFGLDPYGQRFFVFDADNKLPGGKDGDGSLPESGEEKVDPGAKTSELPEKATPKTIVLKDKVEFPPMTNRDVRKRSVCALEKASGSACSSEKAPGGTKTPSRASTTLISQRSPEDEELEGTLKDNEFLLNGVAPAKAQEFNQRRLESFQHFTELALAELIPFLIQEFFSEPLEDQFQYAEIPTFRSKIVGKIRQMTGLSDALSYALNIHLEAFLKKRAIEAEGAGRSKRQTFNDWDGSKIVVSVTLHIYKLFLCNTK